MQAGASGQGISLAVKYADAVYSVSWNLKQARRFREKLDDRIRRSGMADRHIKVFPGLVTFVGRTHGEALAKKAALDRSEEHTSELQSRGHIVCRLLLEKKNQTSTK